MIPGDDTYSSSAVNMITRPTGVYFYRMVADSQLFTKTLHLIKQANRHAESIARATQVAPRRVHSLPSCLRVLDFQGRSDRRSSFSDPVHSL